jgi:hypothetical protein
MKKLNIWRNVMPSKKFTSYISAIFLLQLIFIASCSEDSPTNIYDPNNSGAAAPVILSVDPADFAIAGLSEIKLIGENFSPSTDSLTGNVVYFDNRKGEVLSATATEIVVVPPNITGDSVTIQVVVPGAYNTAEHSPYELKVLVEQLTAFNPTEDVYAVALDLDENLYAHVREGGTGIIYQVSPTGEKVAYGTVPFPAASDMKYGPNGYLYCQRSTSDNFYRIAPGGGDAEIFVTLSARVRYFDFDQNLNAFLGGNGSGIFCVKPSGDNSLVGDYGDFDIKSVRVFEGYVYVSAIYEGSNSAFPSSGIFRSEITSADGDLGDVEVVYDWNNSGGFAGVDVGSLTFSVDGDMLVGTENSDPVLVIHADGSSETLYSGFLGPEAAQLVWGNGDYLYQNRDDRDDFLKGVYKIFVGEGAPYYGREAN